MRRLTLCRIAGFSRITLTHVGRAGKFCKVFIKYCAALGDDRGELRGVGELRAINIPDFMDDNQHR
jgi:hypothetical protein